jgi:hypothetical protein
VTCVCLISSMAALSFSIWLQATDTDVACRHEKPKNMHTVKVCAVHCLRFFVIMVTLLVSRSKRWNYKCQLLILAQSSFWYHYLPLIFPHLF